MSKEAFEKIAKGLREALLVAKGDLKVEYIPPRDPIPHRDKRRVEVNKLGLVLFQRMTKEEVLEQFPTAPLPHHSE